MRNVVICIVAGATLCSPSSNGTVRRPSSTTFRSWLEMMPAAGLKNARSPMVNTPQSIGSDLRSGSEGLRSSLEIYPQWDGKE